MSANAPSKDQSKVLPEGTLIADKYRIVRHIARGGFGDVYEAEQPALSRRVAIKIQRDGLDAEGDPNYLQRFLQEASAAAGLQHPNVVSVHDFGREDDRLFLVMEYLEGQTLAEALENDGALSVPRSIHIAKQVCRALRAAHKKGIIHRDIKPANILLVERDEDRDFVQVLDFGLVRDVQATEDLTKEGKFLGTPRYMSPEHFGQAGADARSDVYSLGVVLYRMLSNTVPYDGNMLQIMSGHLHYPPPQLAEQPTARHVPPRLAETVMRCLAKSPDERFESMSQLLATLESIEVEMGVNASSIHSDVTRIDSAAARILATSIKPKQAPKTGYVLAAVAIFAILALGALLAQQLTSPEPAVRPLPAAPPTVVTAQPTTSALTVNITSTPSGADVFAGAERLGKTPLKTTWQVPFAEARAARVFEVRLADHETHTASITPVSGRVVLDAQLSPKAPTPAAKRPASSTAVETVIDEDYKGNPYEDE